MVGSGGSIFWGGNPLADPKGSGSVGGDPPPTVGLVGLGGGGSGSGGSGGLGGWTGSVDTHSYRYLNNSFQFLNNIICIFTIFHPHVFFKKYNVTRITLPNGS